MITLISTLISLLLQMRKLGFRGLEVKVLDPTIEPEPRLGQLDSRAQELNNFAVKLSQGFSPVSPLEKRLRLCRSCSGQQGHIPSKRPCFSLHLEVWLEG